MKVDKASDLRFILLFMG